MPPNRLRSLRTAALLMAACLPLAAQAWWDTAWSQRTRITLNTGAEGVTQTEALSQVAVPVRLHSGNFDFLGAKPDGTDLRVVAGDDKTPLPFRIERFDGNAIAQAQGVHRTLHADRSQHLGSEAISAGQPPPPIRA
jgi:biopolymer transport protein ExbB